MNIKVIHVSEQRVTTLGDWWENDDGSFEIRLSEMPDWRYIFLVLIHELTEWAICQMLGVLTKDCDDFDFLYEAEIKKGLHSIDDEAGFDKRCPYRRGHVWGCRMERVFAWVLNVRWASYLKSCDETIRQYDH